MVLQDLLSSSCKTLLERIDILYIEPEHSRVVVSVSLCVSNSKLSFSDSAKAMKHSSSTAAVASKNIPYLCKFALSCHKIVGFGNIGETESD